MESKNQRKVLIAVDGSEISKKAMNYALDNIIKLETDLLIVVHARPYVALTYPGAGSDYIVGPNIVAEILNRSEKEGEDLVKKYLDMAAKKKVSTLGYSVGGDPRDAIMEEASKQSADLIIVGSRGLSAVKRAFMGSVSDHVVNHSKCPTLIFSESEQEKTDNSETRTILVAVDDSKTSKDAFKWALENICDSDNDEICLMTAQPLTSWGPYSEFTTSELEEKLEKEVNEKNTRLLLDLNKEAKKHGIHCMMEIIHGDPREAIPWAVDKYKADLLILGSRGLGPLSRVFLGSVSNHCCHNVSVPIIVYKPHHETPPILEQPEKVSLTSQKVE